MIKWIKVKNNDGTFNLPKEGEQVIIDTGNYYIAKIEKGIDEVTRQKMIQGELPDISVETYFGGEAHTTKRSSLYTQADTGFNNLVPFCWYSVEGIRRWFGQDVIRWARVV